MATGAPTARASGTASTPGLAFRRLGIIDLDERSMQPMHLGPWHLVLNGEIYNYRELRDRARASRPRVRHRGRRRGAAARLGASGGRARSTASTGCSPSRSGTTSAASSYCACDPFGEKPLYWARTASGSSSPPTSGRCCRRGPTSARRTSRPLGPYLGRGLMPPIDESFFARIHRLPGAHLLRWRAGASRSRPYWRPQRVDVPARYEDAVERLRELLLASIRLRLRADVPVGTSLSGGVDSSAVVALSATLAGDHRRHAFTARFPGFARDEWRYADEVARAAAGRRAPRRRADRGRAARRPRRARRPPRRSRSARRASTRSGA